MEFREREALRASAAPADLPVSLPVSVSWAELRAALGGSSYSQQGAAQKFACLKVSAKLHVAPKAAVITYLVSRDEFIAVLKLVWELEE